MLHISAQAIIPDTSPSDVVMVPHPNVSTSVTPPASASIALARINQPELTIWLRDAINEVLAELPVTFERPAGTLLECGAFLQDADQIWVEDWYESPRRLLVAQCDEPETARRRAALLNALLTTAQ